jgi:hypothetical protein
MCNKCSEESHDKPARSTCPKFKLHICVEHCRYIFLFMARKLIMGQSLLFGAASRSQTHHTRYDSSGRVISPSQIPLPTNTQHSQATDIHATGGIRTRNPNNRAATYARLKSAWPRGSALTLHNSIKICGQSVGWLVGCLVGWLVV